VSVSTPDDATRATPAGPVLVVHGDAQFAERIVRALWDQGLRAESVPDGERAIDRFVQAPACALVVDAALAGRDGAATIESIRWAPGGARIPVVLTAERAGGAKLSETGKRLGAATLEGAAARDPVAVAELIRRGLGGSAPPASARDVLTSPGIDATHTSPTLSTVASDASEGLADDDSLPPVLPAVAKRATRERETVAARARPPIRAAEGSSPFVRGDDPGADQEGDDVERRAADLTPGAATLAGRFAQLPFPRLLAQLAAQRATGALVVVAPDDERLRTTTGESPKKVVYFRNGVPVYVKSNLVRECLGQILVQSDAITPHVRNESVQRMRAGEGRQGAILLAMGVLAPHELREALEEQLRVKLYDLFSWEDADFRFSSRVLPPPEVVTLELGLAEIVFEGVVRRITPVRLLELLGPHLGEYVVPITDRLTRFVRLDLVVEARLVLRVLDGTQRLQDLLTIAGQRPGAAAQLVYAMECLGALRFSDLPVPTERVGDALNGPVPDDTAREPAVELAARADPPGLPSPAATDLPRGPDPTAWDDLTTDESGLTDARKWMEEARRTIAIAPTVAVERAAPAAVEAPPPSPVPSAAATPASSAPTPPVDSAPAIPIDGAALDVRVARIAEAERHFRRGERALARDKRDDAEAAFARAVELVPDEGGFLARLAHTRLVASPNDAAVVSAALAELERATALAPKRDLTHLLLAEARRLTGDVRGARDAYENALAANPDCREALEGLRSL
jgi:CheY-like chemotaxis protein